jgi:hypothetical protein
VSEEPQPSGPHPDPPPLPRGRENSSKAPGWAFFVLVGFLIGNGTGFLAATILGGPRAGTADAPGGIDAEPSTERPADVAHAQTHEGKGFRVRYPGNWHASPTPGTPGKVSLETPGASSVEIEVHEAKCDPIEEVALRLATYGEHLVQGGERQELLTWGRYSGAGVVVTGKLGGLVPGAVTIFCASMGQRSFTVIALVHDEDRAQVEPGLRLVEESFELRCRLARIDA